MLALSDVTRYLLARGLIDSHAVVEGHLTVVDTSSRNQNCAVSMDGRSGLFLKQATPDGGRSAGLSAVETSLAHEAVVYELISASPAVAPAAGISTLLPRSYGYDPDYALLMLELLDGAEDLTAYHTRTGRFSRTLAARLGAALGDLHERVLVPARLRPDLFTGRIPWALGLDCPGTSLWREASNAGLQLVRILQANPEIRALLKQLRNGWSVDAFVHHDIKWDNCLVITSGESRRATRLALVDWEFADLGDSCWDAGSVFGNYLTFWLSSIPVTGSEPPDRYLDLAKHPLSRMQPAMRSYWAAYTRARRWEGATADAALIRCVQYAGIRLLQSAYERTQRMVHLDGNLLCLAQLAVNVAIRPLEASHHLLGIAGQPG